MDTIKKIYFGLLCLAVIAGGCGPDKQEESGADIVRQHMLSDPEHLHPMNANDNGSTTIFLNLFQTLYNVDFKTYELQPILAKERAVFGTTDKGEVTMDIEIREEAKWDDGTPITGHDVAFSLKTIKCPKTDNLAKKPYMEHLQDIIVDETNPKKFRFICPEPYMIAESALKELYIIPKKAYDPKGLLDKYTVNQLVTGGDALDNDPILNQFADEFNGNTYQREVVEGSGPYKLAEWKTNQRVTVTKKENWWGDQLAKENHWFEAFPKSIVFETINDLTTAVVALKGAKIDVMKGIEPIDFVNDLQKSEQFKKSFNGYTPPLFSYDYFCFNLQSEKFKDKKTRQALAHVMNVDQLIKTVCNGLGERVSSFTHPSIKKRINPDIVPYPHDIEKAKALLAEAGWADSDKDGILDKSVDGELMPFTINLNHNIGNRRREKACLIFQEEARKVGIRVNILPLEWSVLLEKTKEHNFEMFILGWISSPLEEDPKQIWHSSSYDGGSNYGGFGDAKSDKLLDDMRKELNDEKRFALYHQLHAIIHDEVPYIFLVSQKERIAIHKKYANSFGTGMRPGYWVSGFGAAQPMAN